MSQGSTAPLRIGLAGLGTVGSGVVRLLTENRSLIERRAGRAIEVSAVSARDRNRDRGIDVSSLRWFDDATDLAEHDGVDVVVELIGGSDGPALTLARATFAAGKGFVTANKAMIAHHGGELTRLAEAAKTALKFEAAVAGGIPVIKGIREGASGNALSSVYGILNGTCNYILTTMEREGGSFAEVLEAAQRLGYAEADPTFDIDGIDAAHKLAILASLAFGTELDFEGVVAEGIRSVAPMDFDHARGLGYRVKLIGIADWVDDHLLQRVHPCLVPLDHPLAYAGGALNAIVAEGNFVGRLLFEGAGAGEGPTASAVVADLIDIARGEFGSPFSMPAAALEPARRADPLDQIGRFYVRLTVIDRPGVLAEVTAVLRDHDVSVESLIQRGSDDADIVSLVLVTHQVRLAAVDQALKTLKRSDSVRADPVLMHILER